jgi:OmcA/MtrC family decaheme c-type cytochrome
MVKVGGVAISSAGTPQVAFSIADANNNPIIGWNATSQSATATLPGYSNLAFALAKLVPGANGSPSKWVSYIVTTVPTYKSATDKTIVASVPTRPSTDNTGTLVDNKNGTYLYTFYRDITKASAAVASATLTAPSVASDLGNLTFEPNLVHRLAIQVAGNAPGTGTNTANAVQVAPAVPLMNPVNAIYDFIPASNRAVTSADPSREIVAIAKCNECHSKLGDFPGATKVIDSQDGKTRVAAGAGIHGGGRIETKFCVVCHTDQRKFGQARAVSTNNAFPALKRTVSQNATTGLYSEAFAPFTYVADGVTVGDMPAFIHKMHMGKELVKKNYNFANIPLNEVTYPQPITNCVKCHDGSATSTAKTANGDNWKTVPSRLACGACHDGIDFATGRGLTLADAAAGKTTSDYGHIGGSKADDSQCTLCHGAADIPVYHTTVDATGANGRGGYPLNTAQDVPTPGYPSGQGPSIPLASQLNMPAGVYKINFEIKQATVTGAAGAKKATVVYRILKDGQPVTVNPTGFLITGVDGTPDIYIGYAVPQDGIAAPADWNATISAHVTDIRDAKSGNSQTGPDANGYYTAKLGATIPDTATMVTAALGINYNGLVQLNLPAYPKGIRLREPKFAMLLADGFTPRRAIVSGDKCNACHGQLGVSPSFHSGARNNGEGCALCHNANNATGHTGAANSFGGGWSVSAKSLIHSIHGSAKRDKAYTYEATAANPDGFKEVTYPGILSNCEQCHVAGGYDFSGTANAAALPNLLWNTDAKGDMSNPTNAPSIGLAPWVTTLGKGQINYTADNLVTSPITSACFGCHDNANAVAHMQSNGGTIYGLFSSVGSVAARPAIGAASSMTFTKKEQCMFCHNPTSAYGLGIKAVHSK